MKAKINIKNIVVLICCIAIFLCMFVPFAKYTGNKKSYEKNYHKLDRGWTLTLQGVSHQPKSLENYYFKQTKKDDVVVLEKKLDSFEDTGVLYPFLRLYSLHSAVEVKLDDKLLYSYGLDRYQEGKVLGCGYHYVPLPSDYAGKTITITYIVAENTAFNGIQDPEISDWYHLFLHTLITSRFQFAASMFLLVFGFLLAFITFPQILLNIKNIKLFSLSILSFLFGIWTLCNTDLILLFTDNLLVKLYAEYLSIYFLPIPLLLYFNDKILVKKCRTSFKVIYIALLSLQALFFVFACMMQLMNLIHLPALLSYIHIFMGLDLLYIGAYTVYSFLRDRKKENTYYLGTFLLIAFAISELIRYNVVKYFFHFTGNRYQASLCIVALILIIILFYDYAKSVTHILKIDTQQKVLEEMAYKDKLTGLANRRKCDETLDTLLSQHFAVISMDLNNLKVYNDTYGHEKGDQLLQNFASVLMESFPDPMLPTRTGGDEFLILLPEPQSYKVDYYIENFKKNVHSFNEKHTDCKLFSAIGVVTKDDFPDEFNVHIVCQEVDRRMYEHKRAMKKNHRNQYKCI